MQHGRCGALAHHEGGRNKHVRAGARVDEHEVRNAQRARSLEELQAQAPADGQDPSPTVQQQVHRGVGFTSGLLLLMLFPRGLVPHKDFSDLYEK